MINPHQFCGLILEPALRACNLYSLDAMYLMTATALMESKLTHLKQLPEGPALGVMQIEAATYKDLVRYLATNQQMRSMILNYCERTYLPYETQNIIGDLTLSVLMARVKYWMVPEAIPSYKDVAGQAAYYKRYYNTSEGAATIEQFEKAAQDLRGWINHGDETS